MDDYQKKIEQYRQILSGNLSEEPQKYREELHRISILSYKPLHTSEEYMQWIQENFPTFKKLHNDINYPHFYMSMFTVKSQWVYGYSIYECLDEAMSVQQN